MQERIKEIPTRFMEFWKKYSSKQKTIIIAIICVVLFAIGLVAYFVSRPTWVQFQRFDNLDDANKMTSALTEQGIAYDASSDGMTIYVHKGDMTNALYTMSDNGLTDTGYTWDKAFDNSMSTTESEKSQKRKLALQTSIQKSLVEYSFIDKATVFIDIPDSNYSVLDEEKKIMMAQMENDPKMASKPEQVREKIVLGKLNKFYTENCLLQQEFVKDGDLTVEKYLAAAAKSLGGTITFKDAVRFEKGEGIEKKQENFAEEIASLVK